MTIVYIFSLATVLLSGTAFADTVLNSNDLQQMHETYAANQARFAHDYVGKTFAASMLVSNITENLLNRGNYLVTLGGSSGVSCSGVTGDEALAFNKEDTVNVSGVIDDHTLGVVNLSHCVFSRSVPVVLPQVSPPAPPVVQAPQPAPSPQIVYVPQPAPPAQIVFVPQPAPPSAPEIVYASPPAPKPAPRPASAPGKLQMNCHPEHSMSYFVTYNGYTSRVLVTGSGQGIIRSYPVRDIRDDTGAGVFYVNAKRNDQNRTMFFAFNYSNDGNNGSIHVKGVNSHGTNMDAQDTCTPVP